MKFALRSKRPKYVNMHLAGEKKNFLYYIIYISLVDHFNCFDLLLKYGSAKRSQCTSFHKQLSLTSRSLFCFNCLQQPTKGGRGGSG